VGFNNFELLQRHSASSGPEFSRRIGDWSRLFLEASSKPVQQAPDTSYTTYITTQDLASLKKLNGSSPSSVFLETIAA
jgi:hypothetical protein